MRLNNVNYFIIFISILISIYLIESFLEISKILSKIKKQKIDNKQINLSKIIKLGNLRDMINQTQFIEQKKNCAQENINNFFKIINRMQLLSKKYGSNFYFIYLPSYNRYASKNDFCRDEILKKLHHHDVNLIDIKSELFDKVDDPKTYFPFKLFGHYTPEGYYKISQLISDKLF